MATRIQVTPYQNRLFHCCCRAVWDAGEQISGVGVEGLPAEAAEALQDVLAKLNTGGGRLQLTDVETACLMAALSSCLDVGLLRGAPRSPSGLTATQVAKSLLDGLQLAASTNGAGVSLESCDYDASTLAERRAWALN